MLRAVGLGAIGLMVESNGSMWLHTPEAGRERAEGAKRDSRVVKDGAWVERCERRMYG